MMSSPNPIRSFLSCLILLFSVLQLVTAQGAAVARVVFTDGDIPKGWKQYTRKRLSSGVKFVTTKDESLPLEFRSFASKKEGFSYTQIVPPGRYKVSLGFAETQKGSCKKGKRVFEAQLNNRILGPIDVFKSAKCGQAYVLMARGVTVGKNRKLVISLSKVSGVSPFLSNFEVFAEDEPPVGPTDPPTDPPTGPTIIKGKGVLVQDIDVGGMSDVPSAVQGESMLFPNLVPIAGTEEDSRYSKHRFGMDFSYVLEVQPKIEYNVELFFAEGFAGNCVKGNRVFDVFVFDDKAQKKTEKRLRDVDIFMAAGCQKAYSASVNKVKIGSSGLLTIRFVGTVENAMVSAIQITSKDKKYKPTPPPKPVVYSVKKDMVEVDAGGEGDINVPRTTKFFGEKKVKKSKAASAAILQNARIGTDFQYAFDVSPGEYSVTLSFSENFENFCSAPGSRVFDVFINGEIALEMLDIFAEAGCLTGVDFTVTAMVDDVDTKPLTIRFVSIRSFAQVNYIKIEPKKMKKMKR